MSSAANCQWKQRNLQRNSHKPAGEHREGRSAMMSSVDDSSWYVVSVNVVCLADDASTLAGGREGFRAGRWRTRAHRHTSSDANTTDLPGTISPLSQPSPTEGFTEPSVSPASLDDFSSASAMVIQVKKYRWIHTSYVLWDHFVSAPSIN